MDWKLPFDVISCAWPRPVVSSDGVWRSAPEWDAKPMPILPQRTWEDADGRLRMAIDWREVFRGDLLTFIKGGEMRGFHVVFHIAVNEDGVLRFWDDDGSVVRRRGEILHEDRTVHPLAPHEIPVRRGDILEFAQWQDAGDWLWRATLIPSAPQDALASLLERLDAVRRRLAAPEGPPLKMMTNARNPLRSALAIYSMILNGYAPEQVLIHGEHQWTPEARRTMERLTPFARIVPTSDVLAEIERVAGTRWRRNSLNYWWVFKACVPLFCQPRTCCMLDDDVIVLDSVHDALERFRDHDLVYMRDTDYTDEYSAAWGYKARRSGPLRTGNFNAGLYWLRALEDVRRLVRLGERASLRRTMFHIWEQGYVATAYADRPVFALPSQRYLYPRFEGLPGGVLGYDYEENPCGFASLHFGGVGNKLGDAIAGLIAGPVLSQRQNRA